MLVPLEQEIIGQLVLPTGTGRIHGAVRRGSPLTAFTTRAVHAGNDPAAHNGAVTTPIYQASTFVRPHARR